MTPPIGLDHGHDHRRCVSDGLVAAEQYCADAGLRLTPVRRRVLALLLAEHRARGAYELLDALRCEGLGSQPPVVYRALAFLMKHGLAHKIERLSAFVASSNPTPDHVPTFLICRICKRVSEADATVTHAIMTSANAVAGFRVEQVCVEALGVCAACTETVRS
jgi:Fur family zinc uptake transcriptional regulator